MDFLALMKAAFSGVYSVFAFARQAPVLVVEHFVLAATEAGVGTCWIGWFNERGVRKALDVPRSVRVVALLCVGYPSEGLREPTPRKNLEEIRSYV